MGQTETREEGNIHDSRYGQGTVIVKNQQRYVQKKIIVPDEQYYKKQWLSRITAIEHPNLIKIVQSKYCEEKELCSNISYVNVVLEYYPQTLNKEIQNRRPVSNFFPEDLLIKMLTGIVDLLQKMQAKHYAHQNIRTQTLTYDNEILKIGENLGAPAFIAVLNNPDSIQYYDFSPKLVTALYQQNDNPRHNIYKSDVFSLGMCMLQASLLETCRDVYDHYSGTVDPTIYISQLKSNYSQRYVDIIESMLEINEELRPDFKDLYIKINTPQQFVKSPEASMIASYNPTNVNQNKIFEMNGSMVISTSDSKPPNILSEDPCSNDLVIPQMLLPVQSNNVDKLQDTRLDRKSKLSTRQASVRMSQSKKSDSPTKKVRKLGYYQFNESFKLQSKAQQQEIDSDGRQNFQKQSSAKSTTRFQTQQEPSIKGFPSVEWSFSKDREEQNNQFYQTDYYQVVPLVDKSTKNTKYASTSFNKQIQNQLIDDRFVSRPISQDQFRSQQNQQYSNTYRQEPRQDYRIQQSDQWKIQQLINNDQNSQQSSVRQSSYQYETTFTKSQTQLQLPKRDNFYYSNNDQNKYVSELNPPIDTKLKQSLQQITKQSNYQFKKDMNEMIELNRSRTFQSIQYKDGSKYKGELINGLKDGFGKLEYSDGGYYEGQWKNDRMNGFGTLYYTNNQKAYEGQFVEDKFNGFGTLYNRDPEILMGNFDCRDFGRIGNYWIKYVGNFRNDLKEGQGALFLSNNQKYQGEFSADYVEGHGQFGEIVGIWRRNKLIERSSTL